MVLVDPVGDELAGAFLAVEPYLLEGGNVAAFRAVVPFQLEGGTVVAYRVVEPCQLEDGTEVASEAAAPSQLEGETAVVIQAAAFAPLDVLTGASMAVPPRHQVLCQQSVDGAVRSAESGSAPQGAARPPTHAFRL